MGVWQGAPVPVSPLRLPSQAEDAHCPSHGAHAQGETLQARVGLGRNWSKWDCADVCDETENDNNDGWRKKSMNEA